MKLSTIYANLDLLVNRNVLSSDADDTYELSSSDFRVIVTTNSKEYLIQTIEVDGNTVTVKTFDTFHKLDIKDIVSIDLFEYKQYSTFVN